MLNREKIKDVNSLQKSMYIGLVICLLYDPSALERWVTNFYIENNILKPYDINIENICKARNIFYKEVPIFSHYVIDRGEKYIFVDKRIADEEKQEHFLHELAHIEFHTGTQTNFSDNRLFLQEKDAINFTKYASIPFHMLKYINFYSENIVDEVTETFNVSKRTSITRLNEIKRKIISA